METSENLMIFGPGVIAKSRTKCRDIRRYQPWYPRWLVTIIKGQGKVIVIQKFWSRLNDSRFFHLSNTKRGDFLASGPNMLHAGQQEMCLPGTEDREVMICKNKISTRHISLLEKDV